MILVLLLLILPVDVKQATRGHLQALQSVSATEHVGKYAYPVAIFGNREQANRAPRFHGPQILSAWSGLLRESLFWHYEPSGDIDGHFVFKDQCVWQEKTRLIVPCSGEIFNKNADISRIVVKYETAKWDVVELTVNYDFVTLSELRLVAQNAKLTWGDHEIKASWSDYREFRGNEPKITEIDDDNQTETQPVGTLNQYGDVRVRPSHANTGDNTEIQRESLVDSSRRSGVADNDSRNRQLPANPAQGDTAQGLLNDQDTQTKPHVSAQPKTAQSAQTPAETDVSTRSDMANQRARPDVANPADLLTQPTGELQQVKLPKKWWKRIF